MREELEQKLQELTSDGFVLTGEESIDVLRGYISGMIQSQEYTITEGVRLIEEGAIEIAMHECPEIPEEGPQERMKRMTQMYGTIREQLHEEYIVPFVSKCEQEIATLVPLIKTAKEGIRSRFKGLTYLDPVVADEEHGCTYGKYVLLGYDDGSIRLVGLLYMGGDSTRDSDSRYHGEIGPFMEKKIAEREGREERSTTILGGGYIRKTAEGYVLEGVSQGYGAPLDFMLEQASEKMPATIGKIPASGSHVGTILYLSDRGIDVISYLSQLSYSEREWFEKGTSIGIV
jgi:hypothetical protein